MRYAIQQQSMNAIDGMKSIVEIFARPGAHSRPRAGAPRMPRGGRGATVGGMIEARAPPRAGGKAGARLG